MERSISMVPSARRLRLPLLLASMFVTLMVGGLAVHRPRARIHAPTPPPATSPAHDNAARAITPPSGESTRTHEGILPADPLPGAHDRLSGGDDLPFAGHTAGQDDHPLMHLQGPTMIVKVTVPRHRPRQR
jgi:hypothetical protein